MPLAIVAVVAFGEATPSVPPFAPGLHGGNFAALVADGFYLHAFGQSLEVAGVSAFQTLPPT